MEFNVPTVQIYKKIIINNKMAKSAEDFFRKQQAKLAEVLRSLPAIIGEEAVNFSLESFDKQSWSGNTEEVWPRRKDPTKWGKKDDPSRSLLILTGKMRRSIRIGKLQEARVTIQAGGPDTPYTRVHNFGFRGPVEQNVSEHTRRGRNGGTVRVSPFKRTINQNIPQRRFIGGESDSPYLKMRIRRRCIAELKKILK